tara:strand:+ start:56 stop:355 length:300 start_codon:yes stop_codon:yes gene_type:complete
MSVDLKYDLARRTIDKLEREAIRAKSIWADTKEKIVQAERYIEQLERERYNLRRERDRLVHKDTILRYEISRLEDTAEADLSDELFDTPDLPKYIKDIG